MRKLYQTPNGKLVTGVLQRVYGVATVNSVEGDLIEYSGETDLNWDSAEDVFDDNPNTYREERIWICEDGDSWCEGDLTLVEVPE